MKTVFILVLAAIVGASAAIYYSKCIIVPKYPVQTTFLVDTGILSDAEEEIDQLEAQRQIVGSRYQVPSYMTILNTSDFADAVVERLENTDDYPLEYKYSSADIRGAVSYSNELEMETYDMTVVAYSPNDDHNIARCIEDYAEEYISGHKKMAKDTLRIIDHARRSYRAINVNLMLNVCIGAFFCVIAAFIICFITEMKDVRIKSELGVTEILGMPVIGAIPEYSSSGGIGYRSGKKRTYYGSHRNTENENSEEGAEK